MGNFRFLILIAAALIFGFLQRPDLVLTALIPAAFFLDFWSLALTALAAALFLKSDSGLEKNLLLLLALVLAVYGLRRLLPWRPLINYSFILIAVLFLWFFFSGEPVLPAALIFDLVLALALYLVFTPKL